LHQAGRRRRCPIANSNLILTLGKVLVAAAWADHEVANEEINSLKDLLFRLPELTGREWASLVMYIESPVGEAERQRLVEQLKDQLRTTADKRLALQALDALVQADGQVTEPERAVVEQIKAQLESADVGIVGSMGRLLKAPLVRREQALADAPNREQHFEDFIKNKVFYGIRRRLDLGENQVDIPEEKLRKLALAGGLMARVAKVDLQVTDQEFTAIVEALRSGWEIGRQEAAFVAEVAVSEIGPDMDYYRLSREFFEGTTENERASFIEVLFQVAAADGRASNEEIEEIRSIANSLRLTHKAFINAKLTLPREKRAN
jgi:uncharacterized tellurite resistance protein B-like protein